MVDFLKSILRIFLVGLGRLLCFFLFRIRIEGRENLPTPDQRPLIVISNHFSWFDAPLLTLHLPFQPVYLIATESLRQWWVRAFITVFDSIPIWRGQVDRKALHTANRALQKGKVIGIFPEGGMNPENAERIARGEQIPEMRGHSSRRSGTLARARAGSALIAIQNRAYVMPVGIFGTEFILDNLPRLRRTPITFRIGPVFGPLEVDPSLRGRERRAALDELSDTMMAHVAQLFPPEKRGPYADSTPSAAEAA